MLDRIRLCLFAVGLAALASAGPEPDLRQIMADPEWIARSPEGAYWADDGSAVLYRRERAGDSGIDDLWRLPLDGIEPAEADTVPDEQRAFVAGGGSYDRERKRRVYEHGGDLFLRDLSTGEVTQLTRTTAFEGQPEFTADGAAVMFTRGGEVFLRGIASGVEMQAADVRLEDPADDEDEARPAMAALQHRLFAIVRDRQRRSDERGQRREELEAADPTRVAGPFYLGKGIGDIRRRALSPSGRWMVVTVRRPTKNGERDRMPAYVNADGMVTSTPVRAKVGEVEEPGDRVFLLDLISEEHHELDLGVLPMITDDPLAWLKHTGDKDDDDAGEDGDDKEPEPRPADVTRIEWDEMGERVALQFRSADNKDRWIAGVDFEADPPALVPVHHLRDEAWINWEFNGMGWVPGSGTLWFLSEESGYGHLYLHDADAGTTAQATSGTFEVRDVAASADAAFLYFRSNRLDPTVYEVERYSFATGKAEPITLRGGSVDSFRLSPSGDRLLLIWSSAMQPPELYVVPARPMAKAVRLTDTIEDAYAGFDWVEPAFVKVPSSHADLPIHCRLYVDENVEVEGGKPIVLFIHGAGYTQHVYNGWSYYFREHLFHTLLARRGYIVLAPDFRASEGYGRDWRTAIYRQMGTPELEDLDDCIEWLADAHGADRERVGLYGGSYGGFVTLMAMFQRPGVYRAGAALRSVTDWTQYNHGYTSNILNTPEIDPEAFERSSPIEFAEGLEGALLMCHGMLDDNVVAQDTIRLAQRLIELEKENWEMALYPVEPHGFLEPSGWLDEYRRILKLFEREVRGVSP